MSADVAMSSLRTPLTHPAMSSPSARPDNGSTIRAVTHLAPEGQHLAPEAQHLAPEATPRWRALLESRWRASLERVTELSLAYYDAEEAGARAAGGRLARPLLRQAVAERRALAEIEAALTRLTNGGFGRCERCRGAVSAARLARIPQARYCQACDYDHGSPAQGVL
jgi:DnaK suppressor protein